MKKVFLILSLFYCLGLGAQTPERPRTFEIVRNGSVQDVSAYERALEHTFLDRYRALDHRIQMYFQEGLVVDLFSANEMHEMGLQVNLTVLNTAPTKGVKFTMITSGRIVKANPQTTTPAR